MVQPSGPIESRQQEVDDVLLSGAHFELFEEDKAVNSPVVYYSCGQNTAVNSDSPVVYSLGEDSFNANQF